MVRELEQGGVGVDVQQLISQANNTSPIQASLERELRRRRTEEGAALRFTRLVATILATTSLGYVVNAEYDVARRIGDILTPDTSTTSEGNVSFSGWRELPPTDVVASTLSEAVGRAEDDAPGFAESPFAWAYITLMTDTKFRSELPVGSRVVYNEELAKILPDYAYAVVISSFDTEGKPEPIEVDPIHTPLLPESCWLGDSKDGRTTLVGCLDPDSPYYTGAKTSGGTDGGTIDQDSMIAYKANAIASEFALNDFCTRMGVFGGAYQNWDPDTRLFNIDPVTITPEQAYYGLRNIRLSIARYEAALERGTDMGHVFTQEEYDYFVANASKFAEHPIWSSIVLETTAESNNQTTKEIQHFKSTTDLPVLQDIKNLQGTAIADVDYGDLFPGVKDPMTDPRNWGICMPASPESAEKLKTAMKTLSQFGRPAWTYESGLMPDGKVDALAVQASQKKLAEYIK